MERCKDCKNKLGLIYCSSCSSFYCLECDKLIHSCPKNKRNKRRNYTYSLINSDIIANNLIKKLEDKNDVKKEKFKAYICRTNTNFHKANNKKDPNIRLIKKLELNLDNDLQYNINNINKKNKENYNLEYSNDFNKIYHVIKVNNFKNSIDVNSLLNIIEEQNNIINDLFKKLIFLKEQVQKNNMYEKNNYFDTKLDIINKIYEKEKDDLIKEQNEKILEIQLKYNDIKNKYMSIINERNNNLKENNDINDILEKLKLDKNNININNHKLSKINEELNITEFCMNSHIDELIDKLEKNKIAKTDRRNSNNNKINNYIPKTFSGIKKNRIIKYNSFKN